MGFWKRICRCGFASLLVTGAATSAAGAVPTKGDTFGITKNIPVYVQEFHIWWGFPYPDTQSPVSHIESTYCSFREPWRLQWNCNGYPMLGIYDSRNMEVVRWQLRCIKATGVTSVAAMIHPEIGKGLNFIQEKDDFLTKLLDVAAEVKFPIFFMDEVAFRPDKDSKDPAIMGQRIVRFLKRYGSHLGFYKIDGKPVYYYQTFGYWVGAEATSKMMREVEAQVGGVHWMVFGDVAQASQVPEISSIIGASNGRRKNTVTRQWDLGYQDPAAIVEMGHKSGKKIADIHYPKFDNSGQPWRQFWVGQYGHQGEFIEATVASSMKSKPDFLMLSSWNDYEEGAFFEPAWDFDGFTGDPYLYCRVLAKMRGVEFIPPPLPPKEAVHPTIWEKLGYGDGAGPIIDRIYRSHVRGGSLEVVVRDTASAVAELEMVSDGDMWWAAPQPGEQDATGSLQLSFGDVAAARQVDDRMGHPVGQACNTGMGKLRFKLTADAAAVGDRPAVGVAYALDPANPARRVQIILPRRTPAPTIEPVGGFQTDVILTMSPHVKAEEIGADAWAGWQTGVASPYAPVNLQGADSRITFEGQGTDLAIVSLLGPPRADRLVKSKPVKHDREGQYVSYYITLGKEQLDRPGVHFIWLRAKDSAGNWGSPRFYAVPNYEEPVKSRGD